MASGVIGKPVSPLADLTFYPKVVTCMLRPMGKICQWSH